MKRLFFISALLLFALGNTSVLAQEYTKVTGTVVSKDGEAIIGADVRVVGTNIYTITDIDGNFVLTLTKPDVELEIKSVGFKTKKIRADKDLSHIELNSHGHETYFQTKVFFSNGTLELPSKTVGKLKTNYGFGLVFGSTFLLSDKNSKAPVKFGLSIDFCDITTSQYKILNKYYWGETSAEIERIDMGASLGPVLDISITKPLSLHLSAKYNPSYSVLELSDDYESSDYSYEGFSSGFSIGAIINYGRIGLGVEYRNSSVKYSSDGDSYPLSGNTKQSFHSALQMDGNKTKYSGLRALISFKF